MKHGLIIILGLMLIFGQAGAQKVRGHYKLQQVSKGHKSAKFGVVGGQPGHKPTKTFKLGFKGDFHGNDRRRMVFMKPKPGNAPNQLKFYPENKIKKPKRHPTFLAADKSNMNRNLRIPQRVTDKQMVLPKMRGDKKSAKQVKFQYQGFDPKMAAKSVKEKRGGDIQYRTAYKFGKKGQLK